MFGVVGAAPSLLRLFQIIDRVAYTDCSVLVSGESGTGKKLVVRALHKSSARSDGPLITVNCGAVPEAVLEAELFGHSRGSRAGPQACRVGRIPAAREGTLFLDDVGAMSLGLQVKLLRVLQYKEFSPLDDGRVLEADVRVIAATNEDLERAVQDGKFRSDLYERLKVIHLHTPPLRDRPQDVRALLDHFFVDACQRLGRNDLLGISDESMALLQSYDWPGNVCELDDVVDRAVLLAAGPEIQFSDLPDRLQMREAQLAFAPAAASESGVDLSEEVELFEKRLIQQTLERTGWDVHQAASLLGVESNVLADKLKHKRIERAA